MFLSELLLDMESFAIDDGLEIGIGIFSLILFALSITAYRNTGIKKILFASAAFGLFAVQMIGDATEGLFEIIPEEIKDMLIPSITLVIFDIILCRNSQEKINYDKRCNLLD